MSDQPKKVFNLNANSEQAPIRDKDNASPRHEMKNSPQPPRPNLATGGSMGIRKNLPRKPVSKSKKFNIGETGNAKHSFKSIARNKIDNGHDWER